LYYTHRSFTVISQLLKLCIMKKIAVVHCGKVIIIKYFQYPVSLTPLS